MTITDALSAMSGSILETFVTDLIFSESTSRQSAIVMAAHRQGKHDWRTKRPSVRSHVPLQPFVAVFPASIGSLVALQEDTLSVILSDTAIRTAKKPHRRNSYFPTTGVAGRRIKGL